MAVKLSDIIKIRKGIKFNIYPGAATYVSNARRTHSEDVLARGRFREVLAYVPLHFDLGPPSLPLLLSLLPHPQVLAVLLCFTVFICLIVE